MDMGLLWIAGAAISGAGISAVLGWADSKEPFGIRKFVKSLAAGVIASVGLAAAYASGGVGVRDVLLAFLSGAGVDAVGNRVMGSLRRSPP